MSDPSHWDVICLGAGVTSLAFAAQLTQRHPGVRILVLEKHLVAGGYASMFRRPREDALFDCSLHKLSGMTGEGNLKRILDDMGLSAQLEFVYPPHYLQANFSERSIVLPNDPAAVVALLKSRYPEDHAGIDRFFSDVELHGKNAYFQFQMMAGSYEVAIPELIANLRYALKHLRGITVRGAFQDMFSSAQLRELLALPVGYVGGYPEDLSYLYFLHIVYATLYCGNAYVRGSSQALSDALVQKIEAGGGRVMLRTRATRVEVDELQRFQSVATNRGTFHGSQLYINAAPHYALDQLFDPGLPLDGVRRKLADLKPSYSTVTLYAVIDGDPASYGLDCTETFLIDALNDEAEQLRSEARLSHDEALHEKAFWSTPPMEITNYHALDPSGGTVLIFNLFDSIDHWPERRTPAYRRKKERFVATVLGRFLKRFPAFEGRIKYTEVSSPRTYLRYTNNTGGAGFGALVSTTLSPHLFHYNFPIAGVHFMSTWLAGPSYEAAFGFAEHKARGWKREPAVKPAPQAVRAQATCMNQEETL